MRKLYLTNAEGTRAFKKLPPEASEDAARLERAKTLEREGPHGSALQRHSRLASQKRQLAGPDT